MSQSNSERDVPESLEELVSEGKDVLDYQIQSLKETSAQAFEMLRLNILILGALASSVPLSNEIGINIQSFINVYTIAGAGAMFLSIVAATGTYLFTSMKVGLASTDIERVLNEGYSEQEFYLQLSRAHANFIRNNIKYLELQSVMFSLCMILFLDSVIYLTSGYLAALYSPSFGRRFIFFCLLTLLTLMLDIALYRSSEIYSKVYS